MIFHHAIKQGSRMMNAFEHNGNHKIQLLFRQGFA